MSRPVDDPELDVRLQSLLDRARGGDRAALDGLIHHACDRLLLLTRRMLRFHPGIQRWEQTDDVFQNAMVRLHRALESAEVVDLKHFFNLATLQIRRELIDLGRKHFGPHGIGCNHHTDQPAASEGSAAGGGALDAASAEPADLEAWTAFHAAVHGLPPEERDVVDLLFYGGVSQQDAAQMLGCSERTVRRRWHTARIRIHESVTDGEGPPPTVV